MPSFSVGAWVELEDLPEHLHQVGEGALVERHLAALHVATALVERHFHREVTAPLRDLVHVDLCAVPRAAREAHLECAHAVECGAVTLLEQVRGRSA